jgi:hypothetical protein
LNWSDRRGPRGAGTPEGRHQATSTARSPGT